MDGDVLTSDVFLNASNDEDNSDANLELVEKAAELRDACADAFNDLLSPNESESEYNENQSPASAPAGNVFFGDTPNNAQHQERYGFSPTVPNGTPDSGFGPYNPSGLLVRSNQRAGADVLTTRELVEMAATNRIVREGFSPAREYNDQEVSLLKAELLKREELLQERLRVQSQLEKDLKDVGAENIRIQNQLSMALEDEKQLRARIAALEAEKELFEDQMEQMDRDRTHSAAVQRERQACEQKLSELTAGFERERSEWIVEREHLNSELRKMEKEKTDAEYLLSKEREGFLQEKHRLASQVEGTQRMVTDLENKVKQEQSHKAEILSKYCRQGDRLIDLSCRLVEALELPAISIARNVDGSANGVVTALDAMERALNATSALKERLFSQQLLLNEAVKADANTSVPHLTSSPIKRGERSLSLQNLRDSESAARQTIDELKAEFDSLKKEQAECKQRAAKQMLALYSAWKEKYETLGKQYMDDVNSLHSELKTAQDKRAEDMIVLNEGHQQEISRLKENLEIERKKLLSDLENKHKKEIETLKADFSRTLKEKTDAELEERKISHAKELSKIRDEHRRNVENLRSLIKEQAENLNKRRTDEIARLKKQHTDAMRNLKLDFDSQAANYKTKINALEDEIKSLQSLATQETENRPEVLSSNIGSPDIRSTEIASTTHQMFIPGILATGVTTNIMTSRSVLVPLPGQFTYFTPQPIPLESAAPLSRPRSRVESGQPLQRFPAELKVPRFTVDSNAPLSRSTQNGAVTRRNGDDVIPNNSNNCILTRRKQKSTTSAARIVV